jgi:DNA-binding MarR family transcriptional regulator
MARQQRDQRFPYWFARVSRALSQHLLLYVESDFGLNVAEYRILNTLADPQVTSIRDISVEALVDKAQVTRAVARLTARGLVVQVVDGRDRRLRIVTPTRAGRALIAVTAPFTANRQRRLESRLTATERRTAWKVLRVLAEEADLMLSEEARQRAITLPRRNPRKQTRRHRRKKP